MDEHGAQQYRGRGRAGDGQGEYGNDGAGYAGVVPRFRGDKAFYGALAEFFPFLGLGGALGHIVGNPGGYVLADTRYRADYGADYSRTDDGLPIFRHFPQLGQDSFNFGVDHLDLRMAHDRYDLGEAEGAHHGGQQGNAAGEVMAAKGKADVGMDAFHADHGDEEADKTSYPALEGVLGGGQVAAYYDAENGEPDKLERLEGQSHIADHGGEDRHGDHRYDRAQERAGGGYTDRPSGLTCLGERKTVQRGGSGSRGARNVEKNSASAPSVDGADVHADEYEYGIVGLHGVGEGREQGDAHGGGEAREHADYDAQFRRPNYVEKRSKV